MLERIASYCTVIFDKTGKLTYGLPERTETLCAPGVTAEAALRMAASWNNNRSIPWPRRF